MGRTLTFTSAGHGAQAGGLFHQGAGRRGFEKNTWHVDADHPEPGPLDYQAVEAENFHRAARLQRCVGAPGKLFNAVRTRKPTVENEVLVIMRPSAVTWRITPISRHDCNLGCRRENDSRIIRRPVTEK